MAKQVTEITLGVDVSKDTLVIYDWDSGELTELANDPQSIQGWLKGLSAPIRLAVESTSNYHLKMIDAAHRHGCTVCLVNPRQLAQSFREVGFSTRALMSEIRRILRRLDERLLALIRALGWEGDYRRALSVPGIGPLNAVALVATFHRGAFASADAFVAYLGLDVRIRESGLYKGKRKLTKRGPAELRRLLYCAAKPARSYQPFADYHQRQLEKGLPKIAANCILARKLARIAFALIARQQTFQQKEIAYSQAP